MESFEESDPSINALKSSGKSPFADCPTSIKGVLLVDRRVLLVKNSRDEWELPGGRIDEGEDHAETLSREFAEELSIDVAMSTAHRFIPFRGHSWATRFHRDIWLHARR